MQSIERAQWGGVSHARCIRVDCMRFELFIGLGDVPFSHKWRKMVCPGGTVHGLL